MPRRQSQRGPAQILIKSLIPLYSKATAIVNILIKEGLSFRRQNMFIDINMHLDHYKTAVAARDYDFFKRMPEELMVHTPFKNMRSYRVIGMGTFHNTKTGLDEQRRISFYTDGPTDGPTLEAEALEKFGVEDYEPDLIMTGFERQWLWENTKTDWTEILGIPEI